MQRVQLPPLIAPFRYTIIEEKLYRGSYPKERNFRFLKRLKLKTILSLVPDPPCSWISDFYAKQGIVNIHLPVDKVKDNVPLTYTRAAQAIQIIINEDNLPLYVHCLDGANVTGLVIACLRKLQMWTISSALSEFSRFLRGGVATAEESEFVEKFAGEIEIPSRIPEWLWGGNIGFKRHPTMRLRFADPEMEREVLKKNEKEVEEEKTREKGEKKMSKVLLGELLEPTISDERYEIIEDEGEDDGEAEMSMTLQALALEGWKSGM
ncbi:uncharacterized protein VTP21DRAFT_4720 [Calcarisporiella thermophila]|uniref:uncharacterized protein n=1 Tax=Calcarisporiella thermophila TaxID=911321 RepID=UPI003742531C